ncbi:MAG TPA: type II secretion system protein [Patescibacteria group bacterium]
MKKKKAFTLIELLVVMAIMGILTIIAVSQFVTAKKKARDVSRKGDLDAVGKALLMYYVDYGTMPLYTTQFVNADNSHHVLNALLAGGGDMTDASDGYTYMKNVPYEKIGGMPPFCFVTSVDGKKFAIFSSLENTLDSDYDKYNPGNGYGGGGTFSDTICGQGATKYHYVNLSPNATYDNTTGVK